MLILSQDKMLAIPFGHYILKVMNSKDMEIEKWKIEDSIYPWAVVAMVGLDNCEVLGQYETKEQAQAVLSLVVSAPSMHLTAVDMPSVEAIKTYLSENSDNYKMETE